MRVCVISSFVLAGALILAPSVFAVGGDTALATAEETIDAVALIERYRAASAVFNRTKPSPEEIMEMQIKARDDAAAALKAHPDKVLAAAEQILRESTDSKRRYDIVNTLEMFQTRKCADLLHKVLEDARDPEDKDAYERMLRASAVRTLRAMSSRVNVRGPDRLRPEEEHDPRVPGLLPYLIAASHDKSEEVRGTALKALADCREPAAHAVLRESLKDPSGQVRFHAACYLTEYQDASGLPEMKLALARLRAAMQEPNPPKEFAFWGEIALLVSSFERLTGKSFGKVPMSPLLLSDGRQYEPNKRENKRLLDAWAQWFEEATAPRIEVPLPNDYAKARRDPELSRQLDEVLQYDKQMAARRDMSEEELQTASTEEICRHFVYSSMGTWFSLYDDRDIGIARAIRASKTLQALLKRADLVEGMIRVYSNAPIEPERMKDVEPGGVAIAMLKCDQLLMYPGVFERTQGYEERLLRVLCERYRRMTAVNAKRGEDPLYGASLGSGQSLVLRLLEKVDPQTYERWRRVTPEDEPHFYAEIERRFVGK